MIREGNSKKEERLAERSSGLGDLRISRESEEKCEGKVGEKSEGPVRSGR